MTEAQKEAREALIDILTAKREHKIEANSQGGYDCKCGPRASGSKPPTNRSRLSAPGIVC